MSTRKLYWEQPLAATFSARVVAHAVWNGAPSLILDATGFYPEAGGQMADRGVLGGRAVSDVQVDDAGVIHHVLAGDLPAVGAALDGEIDFARRRAHMALHTGQHLLSRALLDEARGETVSSRLGENACTIDIDVAQPDEAAIARAEALANSVVDGDPVVRAFFPEPGELATLKLRREPKVASNVRVIAVGDFDLSPCGGTHCLSAGQVGLIRVTGVERYKGKVRVTFTAGRRARDELWRHDDVLRGLGRELTCGPVEVPAAVGKLRRDLTATREALGQARARLAASLAVELLATAKDKVVVALLEDADAEMLRIVAKRITAEPGFVALLGAASAEAIHVLAAGTGIDCGALVKRLCAAGGGRGGGGAERAEGRLPPTADWSTLVAAALVG